MQQLSLKFDTHCMVDLETLGTRSGDIVLSIGACLFSVDDGIYSEIYMTIDPHDSKALGLKHQKSRSGGRSRVRRLTPLRSRVSTQLPLR